MKKLLKLDCEVNLIKTLALTKIKPLTAHQHVKCIQTFTVIIYYQAIRQAECD